MIKKLLPKSELTRNLLTLMTGTTIAQAIPIFISPILTRLYSPEEFGTLGLFVAIASVVSVVATGRYELAIIQPRLKKNVNALVVISLFISVLVSLLSLIIVVFFNQEIGAYLGTETLSAWLYAVPLVVLLSGCFRALSYWHNREKKYLDLAKAKVVQSSTNSGINLVFAGSKINAFGLVFGYIVGLVFAVLALVKLVFRKENRFLLDISFGRVLVLAKRYKRYPIYSAPGALLDSASLQMPVLLISRFFDISTAGFFNFTFRIINAPLALISSSLSQVLIQKLATSPAHEVFDIVIKILIKLFLCSLPIVMILFFLGEDIFALIFSEQWRVAGEFASILIFSAAIRFVVSPLSMVLALERNVRLGVLWQVLYFVSVTSVLFWASSFEIKDFLLAFVIQDILMYLLYLGFIISASRQMKQCVA